MSDHAEKIGRLETKVGILEGSIGGIENGFEHQREDIGKLFKGQGEIKTAIVQSISDLHEKLPCGRNSAKIETLEKKTNGYGIELDEINAAVGVETGERKKAIGWSNGLRWALNIIIAIAMVVVATIALRNGTPVP